MDILAIGDLTVDQIFGPLSALPVWGQETEVASMDVRLGGNTGNFALAAAALGLKVACAGPVGADRLADWVRAELTRHGVDHSLVETNGEFGTSVTTALIRHDGERLFVTFPGALRALPEMVSRGNFPPARIALFSGWCQPPRIAADVLVAAFSRLKRAGVKVAIDLAWSDASWAVRHDVVRALASADFALMNDDEARALAETDDPLSAAVILRERLGSAGVLIVKCGSAGVVVCESDRDPFRIPAVPVPESLAAVGAGDSFNAGFLHALVRQNLNVVEAAGFGSAFAAWQLTYGRAFQVDPASVHAFGRPARRPSSGDPA